MRQAKTNDVITFYEEKGYAGKLGETITFIHGLRHDHTQFDRQVLHFSHDGYRTLTYDIRGHGRSLSTSTRDYTIDLLAEDLKSLFTKLGIKKSHLVGVSLGGAIAQAYAGNYPEDVAKLILAGTFAPKKSFNRQFFFL